MDFMRITAIYRGSALGGVALIRSRVITGLMMFVIPSIRLGDWVIGTCCPFPHQYEITSYLSAM